MAETLETDLLIASADPMLLQMMLFRPGFSLKMHLGEEQYRLKLERASRDVSDHLYWSDDIYKLGSPVAQRLWASGLVDSLKLFAIASDTVADGSLYGAANLAKIGEVFQLSPSLGGAVMSALDLGLVSVDESGWFDDVSWTSFEHDVPSMETDFKEAFGDLLTGRKVQHIIILPSLGKGGAEKVAFAHYRVLADVLKERVVLIEADHTSAELNGYIPGDIRSISLPALASKVTGRPYQHISTDLKCALLRKIVAEFKPSTCQIVNSYVGFETLKKGPIGCDRTLVSLFCFHQDSGGGLTGYARDLGRYGRVEVITDNETFKTALCDIYGVDPADVFALRYPVRENPRFLPPFERSGVRAAVLWASRLDWQKQPEVLIDVAKLLPDVDFYVYGSAIMNDSASTLHDLENVFMEGPFAKFGDIEDRAYTCFLYTARFDGKPNILLEAAASGMAIVSSNVGGIAEVINGDAGILIDDFEDARQYADAITRLIENPRLARNLALRSMYNVQTDHSEQQFEDALKAFYRSRLPQAAETDAAG